MSEESQLSTTAGLDAFGLTAPSFFRSHSIALPNTLSPQPLSLSFASPSSLANSASSKMRTPKSSSSSRRRRRRLREVVKARWVAVRDAGRALRAEERAPVVQMRPRGG